MPLSLVAPSLSSIEKRGRKASFSRSPLAGSKQAIHILASRVQDYLHFPDPSPLYALCGALVAHYLPGPPVWLMLTGPPSSGKTELLKTLYKIPKLVRCSSIKGEAAFLSGSSKRERNSESTGGLLHEIGDSGILVFKDLTSLLSMNKDNMSQVFAALREIYDGYWNRSVGVEGGKTLEWHGRATILAGVTNDIDRHSSALTSMGQRFLYYRYPISDGWAESWRALSVDMDPNASSEAMQDAMIDFCASVGILDNQLNDLPTLTAEDRIRFISMAQFIAHARTASIRDNYTREVLDVSDPELAPRLVRQFSQLYIAMQYIGVSHDDALKVTRQVAFDSMPLVRRLVLGAVVKGHKQTSEISDYARVSGTTVNRVLEDLQMQNVVTRLEHKVWVLSTWARERLSIGWGSKCPKSVYR